jgi:hypothetical protein
MRTLGTGTNGNHRGNGTRDPETAVGDEPGADAAPIELQPFEKPPTS